MSDYPEELDTDDISDLSSYIEYRYPTEELRMCDTRTIHFAYWDKSHRSVCPEFLDHIQAAGYRVLYAGVATCPRSTTRRAWVECRKHEPETNESTVGNNEFRLTAGGAYIGTIDESRDGTNDFTLTCPKCKGKFIPDEAGIITIYGPGEARYTCPRCGRGTDGPPPAFNEE
jgi:uncharacterized C2H2 Zn-finger protein